MRNARRASMFCWAGATAILFVATGTPAVVPGKETPQGVWLADQVEPLDVSRAGKYIHLDGDRLLCVAGNNAFLSADRGKHWDAFSKLIEDQEHIAPSVGRDVLRTKKGTIIVPFSNGKQKNWTWDRELRDAPGAILPTYVVRSLDGGKTWLAPQKLHDDWTGDNSAIIQTTTGRVVMTSMKMLHNPGRHVVLTYYSDDEGQTWKSSHVLDLGGCGHHDGTMEAALEELRDGRLWMLVRTNWGAFWNAFSDDGGTSWRTLGPSKIDASSSPAFLRRLESGRIALTWNRLRPSDETSPQIRGGEGQYSEVPVSWQRDELSLAFSEDDGQTWTDPVVIARKANGNLSYPYLFEIEPGTLWITAGPARLVVHERDFARQK